MSTLQRTLLAITFLGAIAILPSSASAQGNFSRRYSSPSGPTITPYLDYLRNDNGALNPYYNFIRPKAQLRNDAQRMQEELRQSEANTQRLGGELEKLQGGPSKAAATGTAAGFNNTSHYYPSARTGGGGGPRRR